MKCYLTVTCASLPSLEINLKKQPNAKKGVFTNQRLKYEEFLNLYNLLGKVLNHLKH